MSEETVEILIEDDDTPIATDNSPQPDDGEQPTKEQVGAIIGWLLLEPEEGVDEDGPYTK